VRDLGLQALNWTPAAERLRARAVWVREQGAEAPDWSDAGLLASLDVWLSPALAGARSAADLGRVDVAAALAKALDWEAKQLLDRLAPATYTAPGGAAAPVDYARAQPAASVRLQQMFGLDAHPVIGPNRTPLLLDLLSPAGRPVQSTADLPGFWRSSYADVRKDMRGRYPRHDWPEAPQHAAPPERRPRR
jgi:ATP-dependent helicase HrpB